MKQDKKRVSKQRHEIRYAKKLSKKFIIKCNKIIKGNTHGYKAKIEARQIKRICQMFLKVT